MKIKILLSVIALSASFVRSIMSVCLMILAVIAIPLFAFLGMDFFVLHNSWWANCFALFVQMAIPIVVAFYLWKAPNVRNYYQPDQK
jgi:hypothetical protein